MAEQERHDGSFVNPVFPSLGESFSSGEEYLYQEKAEGYDYEFEPVPDSKYECAICLFILRDPQQTKCGHRFCQQCIMKWFRESEWRCPVDNEPLEETDLFPDNFAKREILNFRLRCPNNKQGCDNLIVLRDIQNHLNLCPFAFVPCPNKCSDILIRRDLPNHIQFKCSRRQITCPNCQLTITADDTENHQRMCPMVKMLCQYCGTNLMRQEMAVHLGDCPKVMVDCDFFSLGCQARYERSNKNQHMIEATQEHMELLCHGVVTILQNLGISRITPNIQQSSSSGHLDPTEISSSISNLGSTIQSLNLQELQVPSQQVVVHGSSRTSPFQPVPLAVSSVESGGGGGDEVHTTQELAAIKHHSNADPEENKEGFSFLRGMDSLIKQQMSLKEHDRNIAELQSGKEALEKHYDELHRKIHHLEMSVRDIEGRSCNGNYYWRIRNYSRLRREAEEGESPALHSPSFYSSFFGYKLCLRVNLNGVDSARGSYLSLFIHFMQGEFDEMLDWPFSGRIILSVIDQNTSCEVRNHVTETLIAKPHLAAFQRPTTARNHKGFGYMEFLPLAVMDNSTFVRNDTLIIRAQVLPSM